MAVHIAQPLTQEEFADLQRLGTISFGGTKRFRFGNRARVGEILAAQGGQTGGMANFIRGYRAARAGQRGGNTAVMAESGPLVFGGGPAKGIFGDILGAAVGLIPGVGVAAGLIPGVGDILGGIFGDGDPAIDLPPSAACNPPLVRGANGLCIDPTSPVGTDPRTGVPGQAVMGQFGAGMAPTADMVRRRDCIPGMVLGKDGLCYNKSQISNSQRWWPKGRRPLLTGGDMRAIGIAAAAAKKLTGATKRLRTIGLIKSPVRRRITSGPTEHHHHA